MCVVVYILSGKLQVCVCTSITRCNKSIGGHVHPMQSSPCFVTDHFRGPHRVTGPLYVYVCVSVCPENDLQRSDFDLDIWRPGSPGHCLDMSEVKFMGRSSRSSEEMLPFSAVDARCIYCISILNQ